MVYSARPKSRLSPLPEIGHPEALASFLRAHKTRLFDYTKRAEPLRGPLLGFK